MIVYAIDERWPINKFGQWEQIKNTHKLHKTIYTVAEIKKIDGPLVIVKKIQEAAKQKHKYGFKSIWQLRICCHGYSGVLVLGSGLRWWERTFFEPEFSKLAPYMTPKGAGIELWSCGVGSATDVREIPKFTKSGKAEMRPGSFPKQFVAQESWPKYYKRGRFGKLGTLATGGQPPAHTKGRSTLELLYALSFAVKAPVTAPIYIQPGNMTRLHGPTVTVYHTSDQTEMKLKLNPLGNVATRGFL